MIQVIFVKKHILFINPEVTPKVHVSLGAKRRRIGDILGMAGITIIHFIHIFF